MQFRIREYLKVKTDHVNALRLIEITEGKTHYIKFLPSMPVKVKIKSG